jgi:hypothetical protein
MTSNRSNLKSRSATQAAAGETPGEALAAVARHGVRFQVAAFEAAGKAVVGWAHAADRLVQAFGNELLRRVDGEIDSDELVVRVASAANAHLRDLAALPGAAADHFDARLSRASTDT